MPIFTRSKHVKKNQKQKVTSLCSATTYADNVALHAFRVARRVAVRHERIDRYLLPAGPQQQSWLL